MVTPAEAWRGKCCIVWDHRNHHSCFQDLCDLCDLLASFLCPGGKKESADDHISQAELRSLDSTNVATLLIEQLKSEQLSLLSEKNLAEALTEYVDKDEKEAISK